ncbi:hypothetical protein [Anaeromicropila populeti]|uniref:Uncharacterized protein n=1 Tax=Anaeromicropila populeti TaxID=37658 RepID=A0A1I6K7D3_9FIRM|nr:hypothetical protein [Anaeromicropila populeti]SFR87165.1 hypothetical protein SAMN05661086_02254 [Anaeromicropila populeti]
MKYFVAELDKNYAHAPQVINWFPDFQVEKLHKDTQYEIPFRTSLKIKPDPEVEFTDIISYPCFGVSELVYQILQKFEPNTIVKEMMVYDSKNQKVNLYYIPILEEVDCLTEQSVFNMDHSLLKKIVINENKIRDKSLFHLAGVKNHYTIMRLDLAEALLRRNVKGLTLLEIEVIQD